MGGFHTDSSHLSSQEHDDMVEEFSGMVESQFYQSSDLKDYVNVRSVTGTDTIFDRRMGRTTLTKVTAGVRPDPGTVQYGRVALTVDTVILARNNQDLLNDFQADINVRSEIAEDHGKTIGRFHTQAHIIQVVKGALQAAPTGLNGAIGAGKNVELAAANDELDPTKLYDAIVSLIVEMEDEEIPVRDILVLVAPTQYEVLSNNDKLMSEDFSKANGDYADGTVKTIYGARIMKTTHIPDAVDNDHYLSNAANNNAYNVSAAEADAVAVLLHPKSLLAGETIPLRSKVHYSDVELQWFIDSLLSFGVTVKRPDCCGAVFKYSA